MSTKGVSPFRISTVDFLSNEPIAALTAWPVPS